MRILGSQVLLDDRYRIPAPPSADAGLAWLRSKVVRFCDGEEAAERRRLVEAVIARIGVPPASSDPTTTMLSALGLSTALADDVATAAASYQPHTVQSEAADAATDRLVEVCGGRSEEAAATVCVLLQGHAATAALLQRLREGSEQPPVPTTRRVTPEGEEVLVDLADAHFGVGSHRCPGEALARRFASAALA